MPSPTNPRRQQAETERNLAIAVVGVLLLAGGGLILLTYGRGAWITGTLCLGGGVLVFGLLFLVLKLFERIGNGK